MRSTMTRLVGAAVVLAGLVGTPTPRAQAATQFEAAFVGHVTFHGGVGDLLLTLPITPELPSRTCSPLPVLPNDGITNCHFTFDHLRAVSIDSVVCVNLGANVLKPKPLLSGPGCSFGGFGTGSGHCGLNSGRVTMTYTDGVSVFRFDLHFTSTFGAMVGPALLVFSGHVTKYQSDGSTQTGLVVGTGDQKAPTPVTHLSQSCTNKTAEDFLWSGVLTGYTI